MQKIYVGNFPYSTTEQTLEQLFASFGAIESVVIIKDFQTDRSKGFGFITFQSPEAAQAALKMDTHNLDGRPLKVSLARERTERSDRGDRGGFDRQQRRRF